MNGNAKGNTRLCGQLKHGCGWLLVVIARYLTSYKKLRQFPLVDAKYTNVVAGCH